MAVILASLDGKKGTTEGLGVHYTCWDKNSHQGGDILNYSKNKKEIKALQTRSESIHLLFRSLILSRVFQVKGKVDYSNLYVKQRKISLSFGEKKEVQKVFRPLT